MRLDHIKLAGFKSFVDPTTVKLPGNLAGIVGPNGCGKSNIIDAVRWVMGESSAKYLRGESMADVVFNGSTNRKPAGMASIELHFDNSDGAMGGLYAQYSEITVRRQVTLEGQSTYYLNGSPCRRRDVTDIFKGTGLGPRSYAIIEQGMISRLIEAKPEELRIYLEEAAGISKYKERRRETELRLQHTRENLARLNDIREELQKQLDHLSKQAGNAEKYQHLKVQENTLRAQLFALRAKTIESEIAIEQETIQTLENELELENAAWQTLSTQREVEQQQHIEMNDALQGVQKEFYETNTALARLEEQLQSHRDQKRKLELSLLQIQQTLEEATRQETEEAMKQTGFIEAIEKLEPQVREYQLQTENATESLTHMEAAFHQWQEEWDGFNTQASKHLQEAEREQTKIQHFEKHLAQLEERISRISKEQEEYVQVDLPLGLETLQKEANDLTNQLKEQQDYLLSIQADLQKQREENQECHRQLDVHRSTLHALRGRFASLQALQESALGKNSESTHEWLKVNNLDAKPRLAEKLQVQEGWEFAVETVLGHTLEAICLEDISSVASQLSSLSGNAISLLDEKGISLQEIKTSSLASLCEGPSAVLNMLAHIYTAETLEEALRRMPQLENNASMITREGIWLGHGWLRIMKTEDENGSIIIREKMLSALQKEMSTAIEIVETSQQKLQENQDKLQSLEKTRDEHQAIISQSSSKFADVKAREKVLSAQLEQQSQRKAQLLKEKEELLQQKQEETAHYHVAREAWQNLMKQVEENNLKRQTLQQTRDSKRAALQEAREAYQHRQSEIHTLVTQLEVLQTQKHGSEMLKDRLSQEIQTASTQKEEISQQVSSMVPQEVEMNESLQALLATQQQLQQQLQEKREQLSQVENALREFEKQQKIHDEKRDQLRGTLEEKRLLVQSGLVRITGFKEQLQEMGRELTEVLSQLTPELTDAECEKILQKTVNSIERLGAINLAAISEHATQSERKQYLDQQYEDLLTAMNLLEEAIRKIDQETKTRFKEVYEKVNDLFSQLFPRIFGGGQAMLELTGDDLLETGITVIARPPGKKNSTIHLLSGGEKALTAIALVFAIFQLNPAPFCMLDEVDAPLDDANVGRFCKLVQEMSKQVQIIFISHNKLAIEMAEHLIGVTMNEPGVSRLVAVDVQAAMEMAEA